jgi:hypothetical protein
MTREARRPYYTTHALNLLWNVYHHAWHLLDNADEQGDDFVIVRQSDMDQIHEALDKFEAEFPAATHGKNNARKALHEAADRDHGAE